MAPLLGNLLVEVIDDLVSIPLAVEVLGKVSVRRLGLQDVRQLFEERLAVLGRPSDVERGMVGQDRVDESREGVGVEEFRLGLLVGHQLDALVDRLPRVFARLPRITREGQSALTPDRTDALPRRA